MMLPKGWKRVTVEESCSVVSVGIVVNPSHYYVQEHEGIKAFRSQNVRENRVNEQNWAYISREGHEKNSKSILKSGDVVVVRTGFAGTACVVPPNLQGSNCIDILFARPKPELLLSEYLCELTNSDSGRRQVLNGQSGLAQKHLNVAAYEKLSFPLPSIDEQRRLVWLLGTWNESIITIEKLLAISRKQKQAFMQQLLTRKKRLQGFSNNWTTYRLGKLFKERVENTRGDLPLLSVTREEGIIPREDVGRKDTSNEDKSKYLRICPGDIGYNTMRMWQGVSALSAYEGIISPAYTVLIPQSQIDGRFAAYLFKFEPVVFLFYRYSQGLVSDTWNLKYPHFAEIKVSIPERKEQEAIADVLATADAEIIALTKELERLQVEKRALMQQLLTGKRRVRVPDNEAVEA